MKQQQRKMIDPNDPASFNHRFAHINGARMHYVDEGPQDAHAVVFLIWFGWRHLIPSLTSRGYRVIAPSMYGTGESSFSYASRDDPESLSRFSLRSHCRDLAVLAGTAIRTPRRTHRFIWVGHDWGSFLVQRMALYHGHLVDAVASLCVPYTPPHARYHSTADLVKLLPHFAYQRVFDEEDVDPKMDADVGRALTAFFQGCDGDLDLRVLSDLFVSGVKGDAARAAFSAKQPRLARTCVIQQDPRVWAYYLSCFSRTGFHGGLNMYRVRAINHRDERALLAPGADGAPAATGRAIKQPFLLVTVGRDPCFPPDMAKHQGAFLPRLSVRHIEESGHWVAQEQPDEVARHLLWWLEELQRAVFAGSIYRAKPRL
ncbi:hypothetical protein H9P43_007940 [Blastocladiella emersonii ATCC 22665]|nr:hypothetical protein H9P43_007940 [Blastocladiella emersonii ATCC 22665]